MRCSSCGVENRDDAKFCSECASPFSVKCPRCGAGNRPGAKFCDECSAPLEQTAEKGKPPGNPALLVQVAVEKTDVNIPEGERKTVTALFADIKGSMELMEALTQKRRGRSSIRRSS
jgi:adenylate cyclase